MKKNLVVLVGPTASGKTDAGIYLALAMKTEILSSDSRQFFKEMEIGTAKPALNELKAVRHHFVNNLSIHDAYSAGKYETEVIELLDDLYATHDTALMVGGSGLYIRAVCEGLDEFPPVKAETRQQLQQVFELDGIEKLQIMLKEMDRETFDQVDLENHRRLIRALEVCIETGLPYSSFKRKTPKKRSFKTIKLGLKLERKILYERINARVDQMIASGWVQEVEKLAPLNNVNVRQTLGYKELLDHLEKKLSLDETIELIKRNSRRYAKRQMTWFGRDKEITWFSPKQKQEMLTFIRQKTTSD